MESIILRFDGEALNKHSMDLKLLADCLAGLESLITEVHEQLNGSNDELQVQVQGGFEEGCKAERTNAACCFIVSFIIKSEYILV